MLVSSIYEFLLYSGNFLPYYEVFLPYIEENILTRSNRDDNQKFIKKGKCGAENITLVTKNLANFIKTDR